MAISRRDFLRGAAAGVTVSFLQPSFFAKAFGAATASDRVLVVLQLDGGNDALNTFVPYAQAKYRSLRPTLAIAEASLLPLDDRMALHPSLSPLVPLWESGQFAFVNNVGFPTLDRSHFHCKDVWQTGVEGDSAHQGSMMGWLGRWADLYVGENGSSLTSLAVGSRIPLGMTADEVIAAAVSSAESYQVQTRNLSAAERERFVTALESLYAQPPDEETAGMIVRSGSEMFDSIDLVATLPPVSATANYPDNALGRAFSLAARAIAGGTGTRAIWINSGGFDTHDAQANVHSNLLTTVGGALAAFQRDLSERGQADRVMTLGWSEFGRRASENANGGTDHGKAGTIFVLGDSVRGRQYYGGTPNLDALDGGDVRTEVDFRAVYATIIRDFYGNDPEPVLMGAYENLGFVKSNAGRPRTVRR
jgi:uncharacterized protein (DUF1501 family)